MPGHSIALHGRDAIVVKRWMKASSLRSAKWTVLAKVWFHSVHAIGMARWRCFTRAGIVRRCLRGQRTTHGHDEGRIRAERDRALQDLGLQSRAETTTPADGG